MRKTALLAASLLSLIAGGALAQSAPPPQQGQMPPQGGGPREGPFERLDTNNDGVVTLDEVRTLRTAAFNRLDANKDGFLMREEMPSPRMGRRGGGPDEMREGREGRPKMQGAGGGDMLARVDTNRDGNVTRAEYDAFVASRAATMATEAKSRGDQLFARLDTNRDGTITRAEAEAGRPAMQERPVEQRRPEGGRPPMMANPDTNNDGKVSLAEWLARPDPLFERGDANKDGRLTREEAASFIREGRGGEGRRPGRPW